MRESADKAIFGEREMVRHIAEIARLILYAALMSIFLPTGAQAADCFKSTLLAPSPFLGVNDEVFNLDDGSLWRVKYDYEYLYAYSPSVVVCPSEGLMIIDGKTIHIESVSGSLARPGARADQITVVYRPRSCDYYVAYGSTGYYVLEWYGGHDPVVGDVFLGYTSGYGFKDVTYLPSGSSGRFWVEDYFLSKSSAADKIAEKCK